MKAMIVSEAIAAAIVKEWDDIENFAPGVQIYISAFLKDNQLVKVREWPEPLKGVMDEVPKLSSQL